MSRTKKTTKGEEKTLSGKKAKSVQNSVLTGPTWLEMSGLANKSGVVVKLKQNLALAASDCV
jgi:hypothetical protein